jgi:hypothetical protein
MTTGRTDEKDDRRKATKPPILYIEIERTLIIWSPLLSTFKGFLRVHGVLMK